jgi:outer membrane immunogenic protein
MKKLLLASAAALGLAIGTPAGAADIPAPVYKAPVVAPVVFSWTGFYIGANVGYSWGRADTDFVEATSFTTVTQVFRTAGPNLISTTFGTLPTVTAGASARSDLNGWLGGGQIGYNWQTGNFVLGLEADIQGTGQRGDNAFCLTAACPVGSIFATSSYKLPWFATVRGRAGIAVAPMWLVYVTGGLAVAEVEGGFGGGLVGGPVGAFSNNTTRTGFAVGGGVEAAINNNLSAKVEALYMDFGGFDTGFAGFTNVTTVNLLNTPQQGFNTITTTAATTAGSFHTRVTDVVLRVGLNYRFGGPVVAKY